MFHFELSGKDSLLVEHLLQSIHHIKVTRNGVIAGAVIASDGQRTIGESCVYLLEMME
jgi:hypothetical protein